MYPTPDPPATMEVRPDRWDRHLPLLVVERGVGSPGMPGKVRLLLRRSGRTPPMGGMTSMLQDVAPPRTGECSQGSGSSSPSGQWTGGNNQKRGLRLPRPVGDKIKACQEQCLPCLPGVQALGSLKVGQILVVGPYHYRFARAL